MVRKHSGLSGLGLRKCLEKKYPMVLGPRPPRGNSFQEKDSHSPDRPYETHMCRVLEMIHVSHFFRSQSQFLNGFFQRQKFCRHSVAIRQFTFPVSEILTVR